MYEEASQCVSLLAQLYGGDAADHLTPEDLLSLAHSLQLHTEPRQQRLLLRVLKRLVSDCALCCFAASRKYTEFFILYNISIMLWNHKFSSWRLLNYSDKKWSQLLLYLLSNWRFPFLLVGSWDGKQIRQITIKIGYINWTFNLGLIKITRHFESFMEMLYQACKPKGFCFFAVDVFSEYKSSWLF